jgi:hypothetical protein
MWIVLILVWLIGIFGQPFWLVPYIFCGSFVVFIKLIFCILQTFLQTVALFSLFCRVECHLYSWCCQTELHAWLYTRVPALKLMALQKNEKIKIFTLCQSDNGAVPLNDWHSKLVCVAMFLMFWTCVWELVILSVRFEDLTAVVLMILIFLDMAPCHTMRTSQCFRGS